MYALIATLAAIPALAFANRLRGTGNMLVALALVFGAALIIDAPALSLDAVYFAAAATVCFFVWDMAGPWGRYFTMNNLPRDIAGPPGAYEKLIEGIAGDSDYAALTIRMTVACAPVLAMGYYFGGIHGAILGALLPHAMVFGYYTAWKLRPLADKHIDQIEKAELIVGGLWALTISLIR